MAFRDVPTANVELSYHIMGLGAAKTGDVGTFYKPWGSTNAPFVSDLKQFHFPDSGRNYRGGLGNAWTINSLKGDRLAQVQVFVNNASFGHFQFFDADNFTYNYNSTDYSPVNSGCVASPTNGAGRYWVWNTDNVSISSGMRLSAIPSGYTYTLLAAYSNCTLTTNVYTNAFPIAGSTHNFTVAWSAIETTGQLYLEFGIP